MLPKRRTLGLFFLYGLLEISIYDTVVRQATFKFALLIWSSDDIGYIFNYSTNSVYNFIKTECLFRMNFSCNHRG